MQTNLADFIKDTPQGREADAVLRKCVHCGFCLATCPTYQLLGDELDSPRGRIYLMKQVLEGARATDRTRLHLDRCLTCRACETTCPSGVEYGRLLDVGRAIVNDQAGRGPLQALSRAALRAIVPHPGRFAIAMRIVRWLQPLLPAGLKRKVPRAEQPSRWPTATHTRRMLVLEGCVQPTLSPDTNAAAARVLDRLGIALIRAYGAGCCGAVSFHTDARGEGLDYARRNIDAWWPYVEQGAEAIVITASGCAAMIVEYSHLLADDQAYAEKARRISSLMKDISEVITAEKERLKGLLIPDAPHPSHLTPHPRVAFHAPCTLQHGLKMKGRVEALLTDLGFDLTPVSDAHLCCGSAGTYSLLQPQLAQQLLANKIAALTSSAPELIATANIGCQTHLQSATALPVKHWIEVLDAALVSKRRD